MKHISPERKVAILAKLLPPSQIVPKLADKGIYIVAESTFYRVLRRHGELHHRGRQQCPKRVPAPTTFTASAPCQVWVWDITWLPSVVRGRQPLVLHADNGAAMKSQTLQMKLHELNITPSHSRPRVSNDNAYAESVFRTLKYVPQWPSSGFKTLPEARKWVEKFTRWYNDCHLLNGIGYVTPSQRHTGEDIALLKQRDAVYKTAKEAHPKRWSGDTRNWQRQETVTLNPEREKQAA